MLLLELLSTKEKAEDGMYVQVDSKLQLAVAVFCVMLEDTEFRDFTPK